MKTLIVVPCAKRFGPLWMYHTRRRYDILHIDYRSSQDEPLRYPIDESKYSIMSIIGQKWAIIKQLLNNHFDIFQGYDYVGFWDDDLVAETEDINNSIVIASAVKAKMWQMSLTQDSDCYHTILRQNPAASLYRTNFIEIMAPFYHTSLLPRMKEFFNMYDVSTGWGFDVVGPLLFDTQPVVIHSHAITHPHREGASAYDKEAAFREWEVCKTKYENIRQQYGLEPYDPTTKVFNVF